MGVINDRLNEIFRFHPPHRPKPRLAIKGDNDLGFRCDRCGTISIFICPECDPILNPKTPGAEA